MVWILGNSRGQEDSGDKRVRRLDFKTVSNIYRHEDLEPRFSNEAIRRRVSINQTTRTGQAQRNIRHEFVSSMSAGKRGQLSRHSPRENGLARDQ